MSRFYWSRGLAVAAMAAVGCSGEPSEQTDAGAVVETGSISGVVRGADEAPIEGAQITTTPATQTVLTDEVGEFTIAELSPGSYDVTATAEGYVAAQLTVTVDVDQTAQVDLELEAEPPEGATCVTCHLDLDRLYASLEEDPLESQPSEGGSAGEG